MKPEGRPAGGEPTQPSLRRLREYGVKPRHDLGQNFLVDSNMLEVIGSLAGAGPQDTVLEVGGGLGVLSEYLAPRCGHLHVIEVDRELEPALAAALAPFDNVTLTVADAMDVDLAALEPEPTLMVANLPYGVAATVILRTVAELPAMRRWVVMVQREVGERFAAGAGEESYGIPSVLAQLSCDVRVERRVSRNVFHPVPNVDSVLLRLERTGPPADPQVVAMVRAAFAHRRKALARSLDTAGWGGEDVRSRAREALAELGLAPDARAESLAPAQLRELAEMLSP
ncbi:MAG: 16S rRNA (adenine(1518)-N(6)/adenine(1519)-N(6))-dimethyltransferase RsmA [Solirubrobacterales bacterium]